MWPKDVPPPSPPREKRSSRRLPPDPDVAERDEFTLWRMRLGRHRASCFLRRHPATMRVRLAIQHRDVWKKYLPASEASRQAEALRLTLVRDGWTLIGEGGAPGWN